jgi:hypothetical protein
MRFITRQFQVSGFKFQAASFLKIVANRKSGVAASRQSAAYFGGIKKWRLSPESRYAFDHTVIF